jgi:hypothetical protein
MGKGGMGKGRMRKGSMGKGDMGKGGLFGARPSAMPFRTAPAPSPFGGGMGFGAAPAPAPPAAGFGGASLFDEEGGEEEEDEEDDKEDEDDEDEGMGRFGAAQPNLFGAAPSPFGGGAAAGFGGGAAGFGGGAVGFGGAGLSGGATSAPDPALALTMSRNEADGLCCLAWHAAAKEVPLSINLEGTKASPETLAAACWALCPCVTSLSFESTRLTADGANTVALERLCGLLRGGHAAALTSVKLRGNKLGDEGWGAIFAAICGNKDSKIIAMDASSENIGPAGVKLIAEALRTSVTGALMKVR